MSTFINPSDQTITQHAVQIGGANNLLNSLGVASSGTVLQGSSGADPSFTATPTLTSVTFGSGTALSTYQEGTFTPTLFGGSTAGTTTYTTQTGKYRIIGKIVYIELVLTISAATGTGPIMIGNLPFNPVNTVPLCIEPFSLTVATATAIFPLAVGGTLGCSIFGYNATASGLINSSLAANQTCSFIISGCYNI